MKHLSLIALIMLCCVCCDKLSETKDVVGDFDLQTKAIDARSTISDTRDFTVSEVDIQNYIQNKTALAREKGETLVVKDISPLFQERETGFTPLYLINYEDGWEVISGDKRTSPVIAFQEKGSLDISKLGNGGIVDNVLLWLEGEASAISSLQALSAEDAETLEQRPEIQDNYNAWQTLAGISSRLESTPGNTRLIIPDSPDPRGHWEPQVSIIETLNSEYILQTAKWKESDFFPLTDYLNNTPLTPLSLTTGRMLYYLYNIKWNVTQTSPTDNINYPTITWGYLSNTYNSDVRTFINALCKRLFSPQPSLMWAPEGSAANRIEGTRFQVAGLENVDDAPCLFSLYRVSCTATAYDVAAPYSSIVLNNLPVMVSACSSHFLWSYGDSRVFLIDKYRIYDVTTIHYFVWVWDIEPDPEEEIDIIVNPEPTYTYSTSGKFAMNWGLESNSTYPTDGDQIWFTNSDGWTVHGHTYQYERRMLTGYQQVN